MWVSSVHAQYAECIACGNGQKQNQQPGNELSRDKEQKGSNEEEEQAQLMKKGRNHWNSSVTTGGKPESIYNRM